MIKMFRKNENGLSEESYRSRFYGFIKEGNKERLTPLALKIAAGVIAFLACGLQLLTIFEPRLSQAVEHTVGLPSRHSVSDPRYNVPIYDRRAQILTESGTRKRQPVVVERIERINLSSTKGIPTGSEVVATLSSGGTNGTVMAKLTESLIADGDIILPQNTRLFGRGASSDERLFIRFRRAILPDKTEIKIKAQAFDQVDRMVGLKGKKISNAAFKIAASAGLIFLSGMADGLRQNQSNDIFGSRTPTVHDATLNGVTTATSEEGKSLLESMNREDQRVEVKATTPIVVVFGDDSEQEN